MLSGQLDALARPFLDESENEELRLALKHVPEDYAFVLQLRFLDEMPLKRIAAFVGLPLSTIKWRLYHGKQLLRKEVELLRS